MEYPLLNNTPPELDSSSIQDDKLKEYRRKNSFLILIVIFFALIIVGLILDIFSGVKNFLTSSPSDVVPTQLLEPTPTIGMSYKTYTSEDGSFSFNYPSEWTYEDVTPGKPERFPTTHVSSFMSTEPVIEYRKIIEFRYEPRFAIFTITEFNGDIGNERKTLINNAGTGELRREFQIGVVMAEELTGCFGVEGCLYEHIIFTSYKGKGYKFDYSESSMTMSPAGESTYNQIIASLKFNP